MAWDNKGENKDATFKEQMLAKVRNALIEKPEAMFKDIDQRTETWVPISEEDGTTNMTIYATGGKCTKDADKADPHKCWGMKIDGTLTVKAGIVTVYKDGSTTKQGIRCGDYVKKGGTVTARIKTDD